MGKTTMGETTASSKGGRGDEGGSGKGEDRQGREQARGTGGETVGELTRQRQINEMAGKSTRWWVNQRDGGQINKTVGESMRWQANRQDDRQIDERAGESMQRLWRALLHGFLSFFCL